MNYYFYLIIFLISFAFIPAYLHRYNKQHGLHYIIYAILIAFICLNYVTLCIATNVEGALDSTINIYATMLCVPIVLLNLVCDICHSSKPKITYITTPVAGLLIAGIVTTERSKLFFKTFEFDSATNQYNIEYGIVYYSMYAYVLLALGIYIYCLCSSENKKRISKRSYIDILLIQIFVFVSFMVNSVLSATLDIAPICLVIIDFILLSLSERIPLYDADSIISDTIDKPYNIGIITVDKEKRLLGYNSVIGEIIPEFTNFQVDEKIPEESEYSEIIDELVDECNSESELKSVNTDSFFLQKIIEINNSYYALVAEKIILNKRFEGYRITAKDVTGQYNYLKLQDRFYEELETQVNEKTQEIMRMQDSVVLSFAELIEGRDNSTGGHIKRSSAVVAILSEEIKKAHIYDVDDVFYVYVTKAAPLHDVGKITIDDAILRKTSKFENDEYEIMKTHSSKGGEIVEKILEGINYEEFVKVAVNVAYYHHEKWDGTGYPSKLSGEDIPIEARIMALADVYDALVSKRCYKDSIDFGDTFSMIMSGMGTQFDPKLKEPFEKSIKKLEEYYGSLKQ